MTQIAILDRIWNPSNLKLAFNSPPMTVKLQVIDSHSWAFSVMPTLTILQSLLHPVGELNQPMGNRVSAK